MRLTLTLLVLPACLTAGSFPERAGEAFCVANADCDPEGFAETFGTKEACEAFVQDWFGCYRDACASFDPTDGATCIERWASYGCSGEDRDVTVCVSVYQDCDVPAVASCTTEVLPGGN